MNSVNGNIVSILGKVINKNILNRIKIYIYRRMYFEFFFVKLKFEINLLRRGKR